MDGKAIILQQIKEDIQDYQEKLGDIIPLIMKNEWAFNYWVLDKLYSIDESCITDQITDYSDLGVDAWVFYEDSRDLYLIQNKYYSETTSISKDYVANDFLVRAIGALENGTYTRSSELQKAFTKYKNDPDFTVHFVLYVTNNIISDEIKEVIKKFNEAHKSINYVAKIVTLDDIFDDYYGDLITEKKTLKSKLSTSSRGTILEIKNEYGLNQAIEAKFVMTPVYDIYKMIKLAREKDYPIFDRNIREYLGINGRVNKGIANTLNDDNERRNFFFYNNGITIICEKVAKQDANRTIVIDNPQIVNGCQTVSTIFEVLDRYLDDELPEMFKDTFVMAKILEIPKSTVEMTALYNNIVHFNNSQNAVTDKIFDADRNEFYRLQRELKDRGILLAVKQSDDYTFKSSVKINECRTNSLNECATFGINSPTKVKDCIINIEKLLQIIIAFSKDSETAIQKKSKLLKPDSTENRIVLEFITNVTTNTIVALYYFYMRLVQDGGKEKKPNPFMIIDAFAKLECGKDKSQIIKLLNSKDSIDKYVSIYRKALAGYERDYLNNNPGKGFNDIIKEKIDYSKLDALVVMAKTL